jgi:tripartite-type tricarboxylate transporter receptor subunit TctC
MHSICRWRRRTWCGALALTLAAWGSAAQAQAPYPQRPITFVVPNAAGGAADNLARSFAEALGKQLGQSVVVENLGGASGSLAAQKVLRAAPDGYTLLFGTTSDMVVAPIAIKSVGYSAKDFTPIAKVGSTPMTLVARSNLGVSSAGHGRSPVACRSVPRATHRCRPLPRWRFSALRRSTCWVFPTRAVHR